MALSHVIRNNSQAIEIAEEFFGLFPNSFCSISAGSVGLEAARALTGRSRQV